MRSPSRKRGVGATIETLLLVGLIAAISFGVVLVNRSRQSGSATGAAAEVSLLQETAVATEVAESPPPAPPQPQPSGGEPRPEDPFSLRSCAERIDDIRLVTDMSPTIVRGTVKQVQPLRWSTPDGKRPRNPHARDGGNIIYRPVIVQVEQYLKGEQAPRVVLVVARGGTIGQDSIDYCGDPTYTFVEGEQVVLFLTPGDPSVRPTAPATPGGPPIFDIVDHYTITDAQARNSIQEVPLQQLLDRIQAAQRP